MLDYAPDIKMNNEMDNCYNSTKLPLLNFSMPKIWKDALFC